MKFIDPSFTELYDTLKNNNKLEKFLIKNKALNVIDDYYENYGYNNKSYTAEQVIEDANKSVYEKLTEFLLKELDYIKKTEIRTLVSKRFLADDIRFALGFDEDIYLSDDILWEIFYCVKYCYTSSFFQNNWENFIPQVDFTEMESNPSIMGFMDAIMKEFDKIDNIMDKIGNFKNYREIPYEYIVYLTQLMGVEPKDFMIMENQKELYRTIAENIMDVYSKKGTTGAYELLFNFLGYNITVEQYFFDRRRYFAISEANEELKTADINSYKFYLTTKDPRNNILNELSTNEIVNDNDISPKYNIRDFDDLVEKYGLMCVLGYDDEYVVKNSVDGNVLSTDVKKYTDKVFKYFRTNYIRVKPSLKYSTSNMSLNQLYQVSALLNFLTPEFLQRESYILIDTGIDTEEMILNWTKDYSKDSFYMLDSEGWNQNFADKFIENYYDKNSTGYLNSGFSITPYVLDDNGKKKIYENSLGKTSHFANNKYNNVFFNPISEKIKILNTTKYWGDKVKIEDNTQKRYPVYRVSEKYNLNGKEYINPYKKIKGSQISELYLPKDLSYLNKKEVEIWENMETVGLNGFNGSSLKNKIRDMSYQNNSYFDYDKKSNGVINVDIVIDESLKDFIDTSTNEENWSDVKKNLFKKEWRKVDNYIWKAKFTFDAVNLDFIKSFTNKHKNVVNYDYINKKLFSFGEFYNLSFNNKSNGYSIINQYTNRKEYNKSTIDLINRIISPGSYFIVLNKYNNKYIVYQYELVNEFQNYKLKKYIPVPIKKPNSENIFTFVTYKDLLNCIFENKFIYKETTIDFSTNKNVNFYIANEKCYYKPLLQINNEKRIIHINKIDDNIKTFADLNKININETLKNKDFGSFYYITYKTENISNDDTENLYEVLKNVRESKLYQYKYVNIKKDTLIYSKTDEKLYRVINNGIFLINDDIKVSGKYDNFAKIERGEIQKGGIFGIEEINFYGRFILNNNSAKIYEYDEDYYGFSEQDDDDNFIFNNYDRIYEWENLKIYSKDEYGKRDKIKEMSYKNDPEFTEISNRRPIKVNIDKVFEEKDENDVISTNILREIYNSYGSNYIGRDNIVLK